MSRGKGLAVFLLALALSGCAQVPRTSEVAPSFDLPDDGTPHAAKTPVDPLTCTDRATIPVIEHVTSAKWAPDSSAVALTRVIVVPSSRAITGYEEDLRIAVLNVKTNQVQEVGQGSRPEWSGSGAYLSYWRDSGYLYINLDGTIAGTVDASSPQVRWSGDDMYFWYEDEIRVWHDGVVRTVSQVDPELIPRYPRDDAYFSADGSEFTVTRYALDGTTERYLGITATGAMTPLGTADVTFTEWAPKGDALLLRTNDALTLREPDGSAHSASIDSFSGPVHGWTADGRLLVGTVSPTVPGGNAFDRIPVWDPAVEADKDVATLPNLFGARTFSPDGRWFTGVSRTSLYATQLELYRCGVARGIDLRADPASRSRLARIQDDARRFVRPVAGEVTQWLQGNHTGIDIAAPFGSIIVAADDGVVNAVGWVQVGGRRVCVQHAAGLESCYYHTSAALVRIGQKVARGQPIALIGMTGATTGPHVHWEVKENERIVDPLAH